MPGKGSSSEQSTSTSERHLAIDKDEVILLKVRLQYMGIRAWKAKWVPPRKRGVEAQKFANALACRVMGILEGRGEEGVMRPRKCAFIPIQRGGDFLFTR